MQPVYSEFINFLDNHGCDTSWYQEGKFWLDNNIIKAFKRGGQVVCLFRITVDDNLNLSLKKHRTNKGDAEFESWKETISRNQEHLKEIESQSLSLLYKYCIDTDRRIINTNSTGKDSMIVTHLANKAGIVCDTYFNVTTLDVAESNLMAKENGFKHIYPDPQYGGFYQYVHNSGIIPTRFARFCCTYFKEKPTVDYFPAEERLLFLFGIRNEESNQRSNYQDITKNPLWGERDWIGVLPIRKWTELDIWLYILSEKIEINPKYKYGYTRVGCGIACPYYTKYTWVLDKYWYPYLYSRWRDILKKDFIEKNKWLIMNCTIDEYVIKAWAGGVYRPEPTAEVIQEYAQYAGLDINVAEKYFNKYCENGCLNTKGQPLKLKDKNTLAMNMKLFGRDIQKFKCKKCLMKEFGWTQEQWDRLVQSFKDQGCKLF